MCEMDFRCLDGFRTPICITGRDGIVLNKNPALSTFIKKPYRGNNIYKYCPGQLSSADEFAEDLPAYVIVEYTEGSGIGAISHAYRAFVFDVKNESGSVDCLVWLFPRRILRIGNEQAYNLLPFYTERLGTLCALIRRMYDRPPCKNEKPLPFSRSPESAYDSISYISETNSKSGAHETPTDLVVFLRMFGESAGKQLGLRGFRFESYQENVRFGDTLTVAGTELAALCAQLVYASLILGGGHSLIWRYRHDDRMLTLEFEALYPVGRIGKTSSGSLFDAAVNNPEIALELFFCDLLWNAPGRRIIWESSRDRAVLRVDYEINSSKFVMLRKNDKPEARNINDKIREMINVFEDN